MKFLIYFLLFAAVVLVMWSNRANANPPTTGLQIRQRAIISANGTVPLCSPAGCGVQSAQGIYSAPALVPQALAAPIYAAPALSPMLYAQPLLQQNLAAYPQTAFQVQQSFRQRLLTPSSYSSFYTPRSLVSFNFRRR